MFDKIVVAALILICVVTGIWGWWLENGPEKKDRKEDAAGKGKEDNKESEER